MTTRKAGPSLMQQVVSQLLSKGWPETLFTEARPLTVGERAWLTKAIKGAGRLRKPKYGSPPAPADRGAAFSELLKLCEGDTDAASWILRTWDRRESTDRRSDPAYALHFWRNTVCGIFDSRRKEFEAGRNEALFDAISYAAFFDAPIPEWARKAFQSGWSRYQALVPDDVEKPNVVTLGGAFGVSFPKNFSVPSERLRAHENLVPTMVDLEAKTVGTTQAFKLVARKLSEHIRSLSASKNLLDARVKDGITASKVRDIYYASRDSDPFLLNGGSKYNRAKARGSTTSDDARTEEMGGMLRRWK